MILLAVGGSALAAWAVVSSSAADVAGLVGVDGSDGASGADGADGRDGTDGTDGTNGAVGPRGPAGRDGPAGRPGDPGPQGAAGAAGAPGPQGPSGQTGPRGEGLGLSVFEGYTVTAQAPASLFGGTLPLDVVSTTSSDVTVETSGEAHVEIVESGVYRIEYAANVLFQAAEPSASATLYVERSGWTRTWRATPDVTTAYDGRRWAVDDSRVMTLEAGDTVRVGWTNGQVDETPSIQFVWMRVTRLD